MNIQHFSERISLLIDMFADGNNSKFADLIGTNEANVRNYKSGKTLPKLDLAYDICTKLEINFEWFISGDGTMLKSDEVPHNPAVKTQSNVIPIDFAGDIDTVEIPIVDIYAAAGHGMINSDHIEQLGVIKLPANMV